MAHLGIRYEAGAVHGPNQDACCVKTASTSVGDILMAVICDGVGGLSLGELASSSVASSFGVWFEKDLPLLLSDGNAELPSTIRDSWASLLQDLDAAICRYGEESGGPLATTCTAMICFEGTYLIAHVGDCRAYEYSESGLRRLTEDQTLVARELARGAITPDDAKAYPGENIILQAVGSPNGIEPSFYAGDTSGKAIYLMATDGAYRRTGDGGIRAALDGAILSDESLGQACDKLVQIALGSGETDNLTALAFSLGEGS